jgi:hypothetical protein
VESVGGEERWVLAWATLVSRSLWWLYLLLPVLCGSTSQLSHSRDRAGITLCGKKNPLDGD